LVRSFNLIQAARLAPAAARLITRPASSLRSVVAPVRYLEVGPGGGQCARDRARSGGHRARQRVRRALRWRCVPASRALQRVRCYCYVLRPKLTSYFLMWLPS